MNVVNVAQRPLPTYGYQSGPGVFNTQIAQAQASADPRFNIKATDRAGFSRGGAASQAAQSKGAAALAEGVAEAYGQRVSSAAKTADMAMQAEARQEQLAQALAAMQFQNQNQGMGLLQGLL